MREKKLSFCLPISFTKNDMENLPKVKLPCVAAKFVYKEFVYIGFVYVNLKIKFIYEEFSKFIYQGYIGVYLPKVHLRKPGLQALYPYPYFHFSDSSAHRTTFHIIFSD